MLRVLPAIFEALDAGSTLFIDEIENGLHPNLVKLLAGLFNSNESNPHHAQLICTTHDTLLLDECGEIRYGLQIRTSMEKQACAD